MRLFGKSFEIDREDFVWVSIYIGITILCAVMLVWVNTSEDLSGDFTDKCEAYSGNIYEDNCIRDGKIFFTKDNYKDVE